jgi:hypothetical protein
VALDPQKLEEWKRLEAAATPAPWKPGWSAGAVYQEKADHLFVTAAREAVPALIAEVERLRGECDDLAAQVRRHASAANAEFLRAEGFREQSERLMDPIVREKMGRPPPPIVLQGEEARQVAETVAGAEVKRLRELLREVQGSDITICHVSGEKGPNPECPGCPGCEFSRRLAAELR